MKKALASFFAFAVMFSGSIASANNEIAPATKDGSQKQEEFRLRNELKNKREIKKQNFDQTRETWKKERESMLEKFKEQKNELRLKFKEKFTKERCAKITERMQNRIGHFEDRKEKHFRVYTNLINRINKFIARAEEKKIDTDVINGHLVELEGKINKFKEDYAIYIAKLKEVKNLTCGHSEGEFKGALLEAKGLLKIVHADAADIRKYVRDTIIPDIKALKAQMPKDAGDGADDK